MPGLARVWNRLCHTAQAHFNTLLAAPSDSIMRYKMACRYGNRKELAFLLQVMQPAVVWYILARGGLTITGRTHGHLSTSLSHMKDCIMSLADSRHLTLLHSATLNLIRGFLQVWKVCHIRQYVYNGMLFDNPPPQWVVSHTGAWQRQTQCIVLHV